MLTRRDALRLVAAVATAQAAPPFAVSAGEAAALLDGPMAPVAEPLARSVLEPDLSDPVAFAVGLDGLDSGSINHIAPDDLACYKQALDRLFDAVPALRDAPFDHPIHAVDEAALGMMV